MMERWDNEERGSCGNCGARDHLACESYVVPNRNDGPEFERRYEITNKPMPKWLFPAVCLLLGVLLGMAVVLL